MSQFCAYCGSVLQGEQKSCPNCGAPCGEAEAQPSVSTPPSTSTPPRTYAPADPLGVQQLPMNWYKFVIWFQLFANALLNAISGVTAATGAHYAGVADQVYALVPMLKPVDLLYGSLLFGAAIFALVVRGRLKKFCKNGPMLYYVLFGLQMVVTVFYLVASAVVISGSVMSSYYQPDYSSSVSSLIGTGVVLVCNVIYFNKRKALFVN